MANTSNDEAYVIKAAQTTYVTKDELIDIIMNNFNKTNGPIATITEITCKDYNGKKTIQQCITFGKNLTL